jgi:hypothetical protein
MSNPGQDRAADSRRGGQLRRMSLWLLIAGSGLLVGSYFLQWAQFGGSPIRGSFADGIGTALLAQLLSVLGTVSLTGAVFGLLLLAVRADREADGPPAGRDWYE